MAKKRKQGQPNPGNRVVKDELIDVLLILVRYLDSKGLREMSVKMSDGRRVGVRVEEDLFARFRRNDSEDA